MSPGCSPTSPTPRQLRTRRTPTRGGGERTSSPKPNPSCAPEGLRREEGEVDHVTFGVELARGHRRHLARRAAVRQRAAALSRQRVAVTVPLAPFGAAPGSAGLDAAAATLLGRGLRAEPLFEREARRLCARDQRPERSHLAAHRAQCLLERRCWHLLDPGARSNWRPGGRGADGRDAPPAAAGEERGEQDREADDEGGARGPRRHRSRSASRHGSARNFCAWLWQVPVLTLWKSSRYDIDRYLSKSSRRMHSKPQPWRRVALIYFVGAPLPKPPARLDWLAPMQAPHKSS